MIILVEYAPKPELRPLYSLKRGLCVLGSPKGMGVKVFGPPVV